MTLVILLLVQVLIEKSDAHLVTNMMISPAVLLSVAGADPYRGDRCQLSTGQNFRNDCAIEVINP